ncbi:Smr/MutS family protein [Brevirhabdus sp.]|uniref:Smr/MutS family protein n=1 Tax=Brevirhabdus sp. TaxID=2004514 RepID=UPI00405885D4
MAPRKPRGLRPDEEDLWRKVKSAARPLHKERRPPTIAPQVSSQPLELPKTPARAEPDPARAALPIQPFRIGQNAGRDGGRNAPRKPGGHRLLPDLEQEMAAAAVAMDKRAYTRLRRGKILPEARLDLHGMTLAQAHPALTSFILRAQAQGKRLVLVITGKGKRAHEPGPIPVRTGVLKHQVPVWLAQPPLAQAVLQISAAHLKHGGGGAFYVYLRRQR